MAETAVMVNTNATIAAIVSAVAGWLLAQTTHTHNIDWEIIFSALAIIGTLLGIAWKGGLLAGGSQQRGEALIAKMEALDAELTATKSEVHQLRGELQAVRDITLVNRTDVQHILAFKQEFTQTMRSVEQELTRRNIGGNNER